MSMGRHPDRGLSFFDDGPDPAPGRAQVGLEVPARPLRRRAAAVIVLTGAAFAISVVLPLTSASADPSPTDWSRLRQCESSNNYSTNTGNGHYGAYQFDLSTWRSVGGVGYPNLASAAEQDTRALILYRLRGWQPWQCAGILGLREDASAHSGRTNDITVGTAVTTPSGALPTPTSGPPNFPSAQYFHYGDSSPTIKQFQDQMHARGFFPVGTGDYGPNTLAMVKRLQTLNGLIPNGEIGPNTWRLAWTGSYSVADATAPTSSSGTSPATGTIPAWPGPQYFSFGDHSATIKQFQDQMHARGFFPLGTGDYGPNTLDMVNRLQAQNGLPQTGLLGPVTWKLAWTGDYALN
jgi:peptidoglycan hydrolase-like protein with peptidoglycan-binding domain